MKVDFRLNSAPVMQKPSINRSTAIQDLNNVEKRVNSGCLLSFTANPLKNTSQVASIAPEYQGILNSVYKVGGLGNVAGEAAVAFSEHGKMDFRSFIPYYAPDNKAGQIKIKAPLIENGEQQFWQVPKMVGNQPVLENGVQVMEKIPAFQFLAVPLDYQLKENESFVIHEPMSTEKPWITGYKILEDTGVSGSVESVRPDMTGMETTNYKVFSVKGTGVNNPGQPPVYVVHTPELAKFKRAYGGSGAYAGSSFDDASYGIFSKATIDAIPKFNTEEFGDFNPGNLWLHDRQAFTSVTEIAEKSASGDSYWSGIKAHSSYHNPGRDYQGHYKNPIDFMQIIGSRKDLEELQKNPDDYSFVKEMVQKIQNARKEKKEFAPEKILTKDEMDRLNAIFEPLFGNFKDEAGEYNLCEIPISSVKSNPFNFSAGTVSTTYGKEMKNHNTVDIAPALTKDFASIPTVDIVNGSSAKSMKLDVIGTFGKNNGFTDEIKQGFTPLTKEISQSPDLLFNAKQSNKKWLIDTIASFAKKGKDEIVSLFFSPEAKKDGATVLGSLSEYKDKDVLFVSWGRPDSQKGFPTTLEGILDYFKSETVPVETKEHAKFLIGAGPWNAKAKDWETIQEQMKEIQELDGGVYKENVCYLNGFFTNRIVACADYSNITSRYEPCGITPLESFAGATPVISNKTGGSPDFIVPFEQGKAITNETGFLTKNAYLVKPEVIGADPSLKGLDLDVARRMALGKENAACIEQAVDLLQNHPEEYKKMMANAMASKIDWHENVNFNGGMSAIERYKECAWSIGADNKVLAGEERNMSLLTALKGHIAEKSIVGQSLDKVQEIVKDDISFTGNKKETMGNLWSFIKGHKYLSVGVGAIAAIAIVAGGIMRFGKNKMKDMKSNNSISISEQKKENTKTETAKVEVNKSSSPVKTNMSQIKNLSMDKFLKK